MRHFLSTVAILAAVFGTACTGNQRAARPSSVSSATRGIPSTVAPPAGPRPVPNMASATRTRPVSSGEAAAPPRPSTGAPHYYNSVATSEPVVALTFDDGPHPVHTPRLLDILKRNNVRATFYVVGRNVAAHPSIAARIVAEGHEIANHSWSHPNFTKLSDEAAGSEIRRTGEAIMAATGVEARNFRPPYGAFTTRQRVWAYDTFGLPSILWSVDPLDWKIRSSASVRSKLVAGARPGGILLAHDIHGTTIDAIPGTIADLTARGFRFVTVSHLISMGSEFSSHSDSHPVLAVVESGDAR